MDSIINNILEKRKKKVKSLMEGKKAFANFGSKWVTVSHRIIYLPKNRKWIGDLMHIQVHWFLLSAASQEKEIRREDL